MQPNTKHGFKWGAATAAYQVEGAAARDGKGPSIWDVFTAIPGKTVADETGEIACEHYARVRDDIAEMNRLGLRAYRFSVAWPRVMPHGRGRVNAAGLDFYERLVDGLLAAGIQPMLTLYHWDLPAALQFELGGWLHRDLPELFADYADLLFNRLGDRVETWLTLNEPWVVVDAGYIHGVHPPGVRDESAGYLAGHNLLRAHAYAVARFRSSRAARGSISFALNSTYAYPASDSPADHAAAERAMLGFAGWFGDPVWFGDYPAELRDRLGDRLPEFSPQDQRLLRRSIDFLALNYYFSDVVAHAAGRGPLETVVLPQPERVHTTMNWPVTPDGLRDLLLWLHARYGELPAYVTENGAAFPDVCEADGFVRDEQRVAYLREHILAALEAKSRGVDLRGYFVWSLMDNLEWAAGYGQRFGLLHVDRATLARRAKASANWYAALIRHWNDDDPTVGQAWLREHEHA